MGGTLRFRLEAALILFEKIAIFRVRYSGAFSPSGVAISIGHIEFRSQDMASHANRKRSSTRTVGLARFVESSLDSPVVTALDRRSSSRMGIVLTLFVMAFSCNLVSADDRSWSNAGGGVFGNSLNWTPNAVPDSGDVAIFNLGATYTVNFAQHHTNQRALIRSGVVTFDLAGHTYSLTQTGTTNPSIVVGQANGDVADLQILNGTLSGSTSMIGQLSGSTGIGRVAGPNASWTNSESMIVGHGGHGTLRVEGGGVVSSSTGRIASGSSSTGLATVTGSGSQWNNSSTLRVGEFGHGTLNIEAGGVVSNSTGHIGSGLFSTGVVTVTGGGSQWNNSSVLEVGRDGHGTLNIEAGGVVSNTSGEISRFSGSTGLVTVTGSGSQWNNSSFLAVGRSNHGTLQIEAGGVVSNTIGWIGSGLNSTGVATVTGMGSQWNNSSNLEVGNLGHGTLNVEDGGSVSNRIGLIGANSGSAGVATVTGNSSWVNTHGLFVGNNGQGSLTISDGGRVEVHSLDSKVGANAGSEGEVSLTGINSSWFSSGDLYVGDLGRGSMVVGGGARATSSNVWIGNSWGSSGNVTVSGVSSEWTMLGHLNVGAAGGEGSLRIGDFGLVRAHGNTSIGPNGIVEILEEGTLTTETLSGNGRLQLDGGTLRVSSSVGLSTGTEVFRGSVVLGSPSTVLDVTGTLTVAASSPLVLNSGTLYSGGLHVDGGAIVGNGLLRLEQTGGLSGYGLVSTRIHAANPNTTITASGSLVLGHLSSSDSFDFAGILDIGTHHVVLHDADQARLGVQTLMDHGGRLSSVNGLSLLAGRELIASGDAAVHGDVTLNGSTVGPSIADQWLTFRDNVDGAGSFQGNIRFTEGYSPGNSTAEVFFGGNLNLASTGLLTIELGGLGTGEFDRLVVQGNVDLMGGLEVSLIDGFQLGLGQQFEFLSVGGLLSGQFAGLTEGALVGNFGGRNLWITYQGQGSSGVTLFTAVPEPASGLLLGLLLFAAATRRCPERRSRV